MTKKTKFFTASYIICAFISVQCMSIALLATVIGITIRMPFNIVNVLSFLIGWFFIHLTEFLIDKTVELSQEEKLNRYYGKVKGSD